MWSLTLSIPKVCIGWRHHTKEAFFCAANSKFYIMKRTDKFLEFGKDNVFFLDQQTNVDYIAIEPVIRFFGAKYFLELGELYKSFIADEIKTFPVAINNKAVDMIFIPIQYVIGWYVTLDVATDRKRSYMETNYQKH